MKMSEYDFEGICEKCGADVVGFMTNDEKHIDTFCLNCNYKKRIENIVDGDYILINSDELPF